MTKEDIEIQACLYEDGCHNPSIQDHFADGAKWAKEILLKEACEWLKENVEKYLFNRGGFEEYIPTCGDKLYTDFKKAMDRL